MKRVLSIFALLVASSIVLNAQTVHIVDNNQGAGAQYTSVQAAVDAATAGDIIYLQPSPNSYGDIQMTKPLNIYGIGSNPELNAGQSASVGNILFRYGNASGSKISGLIIYGIYLDHSSFVNNDVVITNNRIADRIQGNASTALANNAIISGNIFYNNANRFIDNYNSQNWIISNNVFEHTLTWFDYYFFQRFNSTTLFNNNIVRTRADANGSGQVHIFNTCSGTQITNNIFLFNGSSVTDFTSLGGNSSLNFQNNLTFSSNSTLNALSGSNNIDNTDPLFTNFSFANWSGNAAQDYTFQAGSAAIGAGTDGNNLGVMNGTYPFEIRGYPTELPYLTDFVIYNNILPVGADLNINVKADANTNN